MAKRFGKFKSKAKKITSNLAGKWINEQCQAMFPKT